MKKFWIKVISFFLKDHTAKYIVVMLGFLTAFTILLYLAETTIITNGTEKEICDNNNVSIPNLKLINENICKKFYTFLSSTQDLYHIIFPSIPGYRRKIKDLRSFQNAGLVISGKARANAHAC